MRIDMSLSFVNTLQSVKSGRSIQGRAPLSPPVLTSVCPVQTIRSLTHSHALALPGSTVRSRPQVLSHSSAQALPLHPAASLPQRRGVAQPQRRVHKRRNVRPLPRLVQPLELRGRRAGRRVRPRWQQQVKAPSVECGPAGSSARAQLAAAVGCPAPTGYPAPTSASADPLWAATRGMADTGIRY